MLGIKGCHNLYFVFYAPNLWLCNTKWYCVLLLILYVIKGYLSSFEMFHVQFNVVCCFIMYRCQNNVEGFSILQFATLSDLILTTLVPVYFLQRLAWFLVDFLLRCLRNGRHQKRIWLHFQGIPCYPENFWLLPYFVMCQNIFTCW